MKTVTLTDWEELAIEVAIDLLAKQWSAARLRNVDGETEVAPGERHLEELRRKLFLTPRT